MAAPEYFHGQEAIVKVGDATTVDTSTHLDDLLNSPTTVTGDVTDITITDPEASVEILNHFGGQIKTESPSDLVSIDVTLRFKDTDWFEFQHGTGESLTSGSSWVRISGTNSIGSRPDKSFLFKLSRGTYTLHYLINNAWFQQIGEISVGAEDTAELSGTIVALVEDRYIERNW